MKNKTKYNNWTKLPKWDGNEKIYRLIACDFAESVLHIYEKNYPNDRRPKEAIQAYRDHANGIISDAELVAAAAAAWTAASCVSDLHPGSARAAVTAARANAGDVIVTACDAMAAVRSACMDLIMSESVIVEVADVDAYVLAALDAEEKKQYQILKNYLS